MVYEIEGSDPPLPDSADLIQALAGELLKHSPETTINILVPPNIVEITED